MDNPAANQAQSISIPVNLNGMLNVTLPSHVDAQEFCARALEQFKRMLEVETPMGESGEATYSFDGDV